MNGEDWKFREARVKFNREIINLKRRRGGERKKGVGKAESGERIKSIP